MTRRGAHGMIDAPVRAGNRLFPPLGGDRMSTEETIALLMLVIAAIKLGIDLKK